MPEAQKHIVWRILERKVFLFVNLVLLTLLVLSFSREFLRDYQINSEISQLRAEAEDLEARNLDIASLNAEFETETFLEEEARLRLGLSQVGEQVVVINEADPNATLAINETTGVQPTTFVDSETVDVSNVARWYYYFFDQEKYQYVKLYEYR